MNLTEVLRQPDGFTPPEITVTIERVYAYKSGESENGPWSFQDIKVTGGTIKLKGLPQFPESRVGQTVTIRANQSKQHGLTGMKVAHESYQGKTYDKLIITNSAKWDWGSKPSGNGNGSHSEPTVEMDNPDTVQAYMAHLFGCANLAGQVAGIMGVSDETARQACFATICIDTKNRGVLLPKPEANGEEHSQDQDADDNDDENYIPF